MIGNFLFKILITNLFRFMTFLNFSKNKVNKIKKKSQNYKYTMH